MYRAEKEERAAADQARGAKAKQPVRRDGNCWGWAPRPGYAGGSYTHQPREGTRGKPARGNGQDLRTERRHACHGSCLQSRVLSTARSSCSSRCGRAGSAAQSWRGSAAEHADLRVHSRRFRARDSATVIQPSPIAARNASWRSRSHRSGSISDLLARLSARGRRHHCSARHHVLERNRSASPCRNGTHATERHAVLGPLTDGRL